MGRSAGYEASVEALQFKKEAEENFFNSFEQLNGRDPNQEETAEFYKNLNSSANGVFAANMAIVGSSNLVTLGNILDIKNPINLGFNKFIDKKAFGYGIAKTIDDAGKVSYGAITATAKQKVARNLFGYVVKPGVTEGLFEEGGQGVTNKTANKWLEHTYNPKYTTESFHMIDAMGDALAEQYGTEEGWKENMLGILIGIAGGAVNTTAENKQKAKELEFESAVATKFQTETIQGLLLPNRIQQANRIAGFSEQAKEEAQKGNITKSALAQSSATLTYINAKQVLGESNESIVGEVGEALNKITEEQFKEAGIENSQEYKKEVLQEFSELADTWKTNKTYWKYMIGQKLVGEDSLEATALEEGIGSSFSKTAGVIEALAWQTTIGERAMKMMGEAKTVIAREVGKEYADAVELSDKLKRQSSNRKGQVTKLTNQHTQLSKERDELTQKIALLDGRPTTPQGDKAGLSPRVAMTGRLQQLSTKIEEVNAQLNTIAEELSKSDNYAKGIETTEAEVLGQSLITGQDLLELEGKLQKLKGVLETINPQRKQYLEDILSEYIDAEQVFTESQVTQQILLRPDFKLKNIGSWLGGKLGSKVMEEDSKEWLQNALNSYANAKTKSAESQLEQVEVTEKVVDNKVAKPRTEEDIKREALLAEQQKLQRLEEELKNTPETLTSVVGQDVETKKADIERRRQEISEEGLQELNSGNLTDIEIESQPIGSFKQIWGYLRDKFGGNVDSLIEFVANPSDYLLDLNKVLSGVKISKFAKAYSTFINELEKQTNLLNSKLEERVNKGIRESYPQSSIDKLTKEKDEKIAENNKILQKAKEINAKYDAELKALEQQSNPQKEVESLRKKEIAEFESEVENPQDFITDGKIDAKKVEESDNAKAKEIYAKYDAQIKPLLDSIKTQEQPNPRYQEIQKQINKAKEKIEELQGESGMSPVEKYKKRIETALKTYDLVYLGENYDGVTNNIPTKKEIEEFQTVKKGTKRYKELYSKLSNWKLLDSIVDIENNSIVEIVELIEQLEQEVQENNTKDEITVDETIGDLNQENSKEYGSSRQVDLGVNVLASVTVKKADGFYEITHVEPKYFVEGFNQPYTIKRGSGIISNKNIDKIKVGDKITVGEVVLTILPGGRIQIKQSDFTFDRQQQLNMFIRDTETVKWTFLDIYQRKEEDGRERKMQSQFKEDLTPRESYNLKKGDKVTLHIKDTDGWNATEDGGTIDNLKIFIRDSKGNDVQTLKGGRGETGADLRFLNIRQEAFRKWDMAGRPQELDLGIEIEVDMVLFGSAELIIRNGFIQDTAVSQEAIKKGIVIAKGYIENGEIKIDKEIPEVSKAYVGRLSEKNPNKKIPIVVFKKGVYNIAFPISMNKFENPINFDSLLTGTPQEQVLKINQAIIENNIKDENNQTIERLVYSDILDQEKIGAVRDAFVNNKDFVTAETLLNPSYKIENLTRDARIRIDLEDLGNVINSPKIRFSFESVSFSKDVDSKNENLAGLEKRLSDLALEVYRDFTTNAQTKYVDSKGLIVEDTAFSQAFSDNEVVVSNSNIKDRENLNVLKEAFSETPSSIIVRALGAPKVAEIQELLKRYDVIKSQIVPKDELLKDGQDKMCPS